jgi:molybdopterin-containing oxidoreductase family iron-sulfur binding subunit
VFYARVLKQEEGHYPAVRQLSLPVLCNHCEDPPCVAACPTGASFKWEDGIVDIDHDLCVGCRACMMACPYTNRYFNDQPAHYFAEGATAYEKARTERHQPNVVMKCNFCRDRVRAGKLPACVANCPTVARYFGDLDDPASEVSTLIRERSGFTLHPEIGTGPSVYYLPP